MEQREIEILKSRMEQMSDKELQAVVQYAETVRTQRGMKRKKELWGNVVAALRKYTEEVDDIQAEGSFGEGVICVDSLDNPGLVYIAE